MVRLQRSSWPRRASARSPSSRRLHTTRERNRCRCSRGDSRLPRSCSLPTWFFGVLTRFSPRSRHRRYGALAIFGYGAASICFFYALKFADASVVAVLLYTYPAMVAVAESVLSGRPVHAVCASAAVALTFAGCVLVLNPFTPECGRERRRASPWVLGRLSATACSTCSRTGGCPGRSRIVLMAYTFGIASIGIGIHHARDGDHAVHGDLEPRGLAASRRHRAVPDVPGGRALSTRRSAPRPVAGLDPVDVRTHLHDRARGPRAGRAPHARSSGRVRLSWSSASSRPNARHVRSTIWHRFRQGRGRGPTDSSTTTRCSRFAGTPNRRSSSAPTRRCRSSTIPTSRRPVSVKSRLGGCS